MSKKVLETITPDDVSTAKQSCILINLDSQQDDNEKNDSMVGDLNDLIKDLSLHEEKQNAKHEACAALTEHDRDPSEVQNDSDGEANAEEQADHVLISLMPEAKDKKVATTSIV